MLAMIRATLPRSRAGRAGRSAAGCCAAGFIPARATEAAKLPTEKTVSVNPAMLALANQPMR
ncbi:MAG: hypothetical protein C0476_10890 [Sphingomonas sp.]|nr:hypothetical protein [Sphingomonas sp.]